MMLLILKMVKTNDAKMKLSWRGSYNKVTGHGLSVSFCSGFSAGYLLQFLVFLSCVILEVCNFWSFSAGVEAVILDALSRISARSSQHSTLQSLPFWSLN